MKTCGLKGQRLLLRNFSNTSRNSVRSLLNSLLKSRFIFFEVLGSLGKVGMNYVNSQFISEHVQNAICCTRPKNVCFGIGYSRQCVGKQLRELLPVYGWRLPRKASRPSQHTCQKQTCSPLPSIEQEDPHRATSCVAGAIANPMSIAGQWKLRIPWSTLLHENA